MGQLYETEWGGGMNCWPRPNLPSYAREVTEFNAIQDFKERLVSRLQRQINTAEHQHDYELVHGLTLAMRIVREA